MTKDIVRQNTQIPSALSVWFVIHFVVDMLFAIPLFFAPEAFLSLVSWRVIDPFASRLVAAALFGVGIESWLGRNASIDAFKHLLNLKIIWSFTAVVGLLISIIQGGPNTPLIVWLIVLIFAIFNAAWIYWRVQIRKMIEGG